MTLARSWPVFLVALALYVATCSTTVQGGDAGEWMTVAAIGGVGHPPGYPLWTLLLRALALVPIAMAAGEPGNEIQAPMAAVILGGLASSTLLVLLVLPVLYLRYGRPPQNVEVRS